jgi:hypothetical protein
MKISTHQGKTHIKSYTRESYGMQQPSVIIRLKQAQGPKRSTLCSVVQTRRTILCKYYHITILQAHIKHAPGRKLGGLFSTHGSPPPLRCVLIGWPRLWGSMPPHLILWPSAYMRHVHLQLALQLKSSCC